MSLPFEVEFTYTTAELMEGYRRTRKGGRIFSYVAAIAYMAWAIWSLRNPHAWDLALFLLASAAVILAMPTLIVRFMIWRQRDMLGKPVRIQVGESSIKVELAQGTSEIPWNRFRKAWQSRNLILLRLGPYQSFYLPKRALNDAQADDLRSLLKAQKLMVF